MSVETIPLEISETPDAIRATMQETHPASRRAAEIMRERQPRRIFILGNGTSLYSSMAASYTARLLAKASDPLVMAFPAGDFRYFTPALNAQDIIVGVSASGEFRDVLSVFERLQGTCLRVGITHVADSSLTRLADVCLISAGGASNAAVMTKTYASTLAAAHLLFLDFFSASQEYYAALSATADLCQAALSAAEPRLPQVVEQLAGFEHAFHFGAGIAYAAALETALKMKEMALLHAEGSETWEMASGPATMVSERVFCVAHTSGGVGDQATVSGAQKAAEWGARVIEFGPVPHVNDLHFPVTPPAVESFASLVLVPPAALLAYRLARRRGHNPNQPAWRAALHLPGDDAYRRRLNMPAGLAIGIDIGGTYTKIAVIDKSGAPAWNTSLPTAAQGNVPVYLERLRRILDDLVKTYTPDGIGMALPGFLRADMRAIAFNPNTPALVGVEFGEMAESYGLPVHIEPDLNVPALAEYFFGAGQGVTRLMTGVIGTGLGAAVVVDGALLRIFGGIAGDNGHIILNPGGPACTAGCRGCAEAMIATPAIERLSAAYLDDPLPLSSARLSGMGAFRLAWSSKLLKAGDELACAILQEIGVWTGQWLASLTPIFMPERIVLCGGVSAAGEVLRRAAEVRFRQLAGPGYAHCDILLSQFTNLAGVIGAAAPVLFGL